MVQANRKMQTTPTRFDHWWFNTRALSHLYPLFTTTTATNKFWPDFLCDSIEMTLLKLSAIIRRNETGRIATCIGNRFVRIKWLGYHLRGNKKFSLIISAWVLFNISRTNEKDEAKFFMYTAVIHIESKSFVIILMGRLVIDNFVHSFPMPSGRGCNELFLNCQCKKVHNRISK